MSFRWHPWLRLVSLYTTRRVPTRRPIRRSRLQLEALEARYAPATITVNTSGHEDGRDSTVSLREAIELANGTLSVNDLTQQEKAQVSGVPAANQLDNVYFNIWPPGVPATINLQSALPQITDSIFINGLTQPGSNGIPIIQIDGSTSGANIGLDILASNCTIKGLVISHFPTIGISVAGNGNTIQNNYVGTDLSGMTAAPNNNGVYVWGNGNTIGGSILNTGNIVSGNGYDGIVIDGGQNNSVGLNSVGLGSNGATAVPNGVSGVRLWNGAMGNTIGGAGAGFSLGNYISGNTQDGVVLEGAGTSQNTVSFNYIGLATDGNTARGNQGGGVVIKGGASGNTIGGTQAAGKNVISSNVQYGVYISDNTSINNVVKGNYIGTDVTGKIGRGKGFGVYLSSTQQNTIGGVGAGEGNVISANAYGIDLSSSSQILVYQNIIGLDKDGGAALGNTQVGVRLELGSINNTIGGTVPAKRNVISGNGSNGAPPSAGHGIALLGPGTTGNVIQGNFIGTDIGGTKALGNAGDGTYLQRGADSNTIGGAVAGGTNLISGNGKNGIEIDSSSNLIANNYVGTDASGNAGGAAMGNGQDGILIDTTGGANTVGAAGLRNIVCNNRGFGIDLLGTGNNIEALLPSEWVESDAV